MTGYRLRQAAKGALPYAWIVFWVSYILLTEAPAYALFMLATTALHETGHIFAFFLSGEPLPAFRGREFGLLLTPAGGTLTPAKECFICAAGPFFNLLACLALLPALQAGTAQEANFCFFTLNLLTALFNLVPMTGSDGGRIAAICLSALFPRQGRRAAAVLSCTMVVFFYFLSLFFTFMAGAGLYPFLFSLFLLLSESKQHPSLFEDF